MATFYVRSCKKGIYQCSLVEGKTVHPVIPFTSEDITRKLLQGHEFFTSKKLRRKDGTIVLDPRARVVSYITTEGNSDPSDNLENLPEEP